MIAIIYALKNEINSFKKELSCVKKIQIENVFFYKCKIFNNEILLVQTGVGINKAQNAVNLLIENFEISLIISTGFAGGLKDSINIGNIVYADSVIYIKDLNVKKDDLSINFSEKEYNKNYISIIREVCNQIELPVHFGNTITVNQVITESSEKRLLGNEINAIAVDMETYVIADLSINNNIPFIPARVIFDDVNLDLNIDKISEIKENGSLDIAKTGIKLIKNIKYIPHVVQLRKQAIIASANLSKFLIKLLSNLLNKN